MNPYTSPNKSPIVPYQYRYKGKEQELFKVITAHRRKKATYLPQISLKCCLLRKLHLYNNILVEQDK